MGIYLLFPVVAGMGAVAGLAIIAVLICRCFLKRGPKLFCYLLWSVVLFRLLCPVSIPSAFSVLRLFDFLQMDGTAPELTAVSDIIRALPLPIGANGDGEIKNPQDGEIFSDGSGTSGDLAQGMDFWSGFLADNVMAGRGYDLRIAWEGRLGVINHPSVREEITEEPDASRILLSTPPMLFLEAGEDGADVADATAKQEVMTGKDSAAGNYGFPAWLIVATWVWLVGIACMSLYALISLLRFRRRLIGAVRLEGNIYQSDYIASPFVVGVLAPKIYLPSALCGKEQEYILMHERTHIRRGDHIFRLLAFAALVIHWFNPLVWLAFHLSGKDMEMACDEAVMKHMKEDIRAEYSISLLGLATGRHLIPGTYLAFGEGDVKSRIKNVMRYKKPTVFWVVFAAILVSGTVCAFGSDPKTEGEAAWKVGKSEEMEDGVSDVSDDGVDSAGAGQGYGNEDAGHIGAGNTYIHFQEKSESDKEDVWRSAEKDIDGRNQGNSAGSSMPETQKASLTVYSLTDSELVRKLIAGFALRYPEIEIRHETGEEGLSALERIDALTARLSAGMGPDVLILDGLPAQIYQSKGLLTDLTQSLEPLKEELQQNILSAYTLSEEIYMLPLRYIVPFLLADEDGKAAAGSLRELMLYKKVYLQGYSRADLLELIYYNYTPEFIAPDGSVDEMELESFLLYTKWLGDDQNLADGECTHPYFAADFDVEAFSETDSKIMFVPFRGGQDLRAYSDQIGEMLEEGKRLWSMDGVFFPQGLIGINAWSQKKELANQFVQAAFSDEMQSEFSDISGFSVNEKVFSQEMENWAREASADGAREALLGEDGGNGASLLDFERLAEQMQQSLEEVHQARMADAAVLQILLEETVDYFRGEKYLKDCAATIVERLP